MGGEGGAGVIEPNIIVKLKLDCLSQYNLYGEQLAKYFNDTKSARGVIITNVLTIFCLLIHKPK